MVHRDIATRNILVGQNYGRHSCLLCGLSFNRNGVEVYVSDFGMARVKKEAEGRSATTNQNVGPISWMAPEALVSREYSEASDAFSFGVLLWYVINFLGYSSLITS